MNNSQLPVNFVQTIIAIVKLVIYFFFPLITLNIPIPVVREFVGINSLTLNNFGAWICILPLVMDLMLMVFSVGPLQAFSLIVAGIALVIEIIIIASAGSLLPIDTLIGIIQNTFPDAADALNAAGMVAKAVLFRPSTSCIVSMILTVLYGIAAFVPAMLGYGGGPQIGGGTRGGGSGGSLRGGGNGSLGGGARGGTSRVHRV